MKTAVISFTSKGRALAEKIKNGLENLTDLYDKDSYTGSLTDFCGKLFREYDQLVFISSTGIAVRGVAPHIVSKDKDPAVVVIDDCGRFSISLLSGHLGGANFLAQRLADITGSEPVITTASDNRGIDAVDTFAQRSNLIIDNLKAAKSITALMVEGKGVSILSDRRYNIDYEITDASIAEGFIVISCAEDVKRDKAVAAIIKDKPFCVLRERCLNVGIGCRKGKTSDEILGAVNNLFDAHNLSMKCIKSLSSIELKRYEEGIIKSAEKLKCSFNVFSDDRIREVEESYNGSSFVKSVTGVKAVAEPCAVIAGGKLLIGRYAENGVTVAVAKED